MIYHRDISRYLLSKSYRVSAIRQYNYKKQPIGDPIRQYRLKCSLRYRGKCQTECPWQVGLKALPI